MMGIFLDSETNGLNPRKHVLLELAFVCVDLKRGEQLLSYETVIRHPEEVWAQSDPDSLAVNGFTWDLVQQGREPKSVRDDILSHLKTVGIQRKNAVFICQNPSFDRAFFCQLIDQDIQEELRWPYHWLDLASMFWAMQIHKQPFPWENGISKDKIASFYGLPPEAHPHRALNGVHHLISCYREVVGWPLTQLRN